MAVAQIKANFFKEVGMNVLERMFFVEIRTVDDKIGVKVFVGFRFLDRVVVEERYIEDFHTSKNKKDMKEFGEKMLGLAKEMTEALINKLK